MKSIKTLVALALAAGLATVSFAASETTPLLIKVPKTEAAMQATRATTANDAANNLATPATHKAKAKHAKASSAKSKPAKAHSAKGASAKGHSAKGKSAKGKSTKKHQAKATPAHSHARPAK